MLAVRFSSKNKKILRLFSVLLLFLLVSSLFFSFPRFFASPTFSFPVPHSTLCFPCSSQRFFPPYLIFRLLFPHFRSFSVYTTFPFPVVVLLSASRCLSGHLSRPLLPVLSFYHSSFRSHLHLFSLLSPFLPLSADHIKTINYLRSAFLVEKRKSVFNYTEIALSRAD